jgi:hypothetical protein
VSSLSPIAGTRAITVAPRTVRMSSWRRATALSSSMREFIAPPRRTDGVADARIVGTERIGGLRP